MVKRGEVRQYADDTTLSLAGTNSRDLEEGLTRNVEDVAKWVEENRLRLNVKKTHADAVVVKEGQKERVR